MTMSPWYWPIASYIALAVLTLVPTLWAQFFGVQLNPGGASFDKSSFSAEAKQRLVNHYSRLEGTLAFWKREATRYSRFHSYCMWWTIVSSSLMPLLTLSIDPSDSVSTWLLTTVAAHVTLVLGFHRGLKVAEHFKAFRHGESEFYDTFRRLLDRPTTFGNCEEDQIATYFLEVEAIRRFVRTAETDSLPSIDDVRDKMSKSATGGRL